MTVPARFGVLRLVATLLKIIAWVVLVLAILGALGLGLLGPLLSESLIDGALLPASLVEGASSIIAGVILLVAGIAAFIFLFATAEGIQVQLSIEENTRLTAALLLRLEEENRPDQAQTYTYYGEVVDE
jgi:hypothetical protein